MPTDYFRYRSYLKDSPPAEDLFPTKSLIGMRDRLNWSAAREPIKNKRLFRATMEANGLPVVRELACVINGQAIDADGKPLPADGLAQYLQDRADRLFVKPLDSSFGEGAFAVVSAQLDVNALMSGRWIIQPRVSQHPDMASLHERSLNTIRIHTLVLDGKAEVDAAVLRVGIGNSVVDNVAAGGLSARIDVASGKVVGPARKKYEFDPFQRSYTHHPDTGTALDGFSIPHFDRLTDLAREAALAFPTFATIGWDVGVSEDGPVFIEGNDCWRVDLIQRHFNVADTRIGQLCRDSDFKYQPLAR